MDSAKYGPVAACGLYCGACGSYKKGKCPGCRDNAKASWCKTRACCIEHGYSTCGECGQFADVRDCKKLNNPISGVICLLTGSDRFASVRRVKEIGISLYAAEMEMAGLMAIKKGKKNGN